MWGLIYDTFFDFIVCSFQPLWFKIFNLWQSIILLFSFSAVPRISVNIWFCIQASSFFRFFFFIFYLALSTEHVQMRPWWGVNVKVTQKSTLSHHIYCNEEHSLTQTVYILYSPQQCIRYWLSFVPGSLVIYGLKLQPFEPWLTVKMPTIAINAKRTQHLIFPACSVWLTYDILSCHWLILSLSDHIWVEMTSEPEV